MGRWGADEFLVVSHERTAEMLVAHAQTVAGQARTADFRWWGDKVSITVSIGAAHWRSETDETLAQLLDRAKKAMESSTSTGGNRVSGALPAQAAELAVAIENGEEREHQQDFAGGR
jgi:PleD family two-component response regulator